MLDVLVLGALDVAKALEGLEHHTLDLVRDVYLGLAAGAAVSAPSAFLRFGADRPERIIALPARVDRPRRAVGLKWISSFPENVERGLDRASAVIALNDPTTGYVHCLMEGSIISARRTAASAALAAGLLHPNAESAVGLVGLGIIQREVFRFLRARFPQLNRAYLFDAVPERARAFTAVLPSGTDAVMCSTATEVLDRCELVSIATNATTPHLDPTLRPKTTVLHLSLRDLAPRALLAASNVVDDPEHAFTANTSLHLARLEAPPGPHAIPIADLLQGRWQRCDAPAVFSPFGLGALDVALASEVLHSALQRGVGVRVPQFHPSPWNRPV